MQPGSMGRDDWAPALIPVVEGAHRRLLGGSPSKRPVVSFYPYVSTKSTIRQRDGRLAFRLSDHLRDAPDAALEGVLEVLLARLKGLPEPATESTRAYREFLHGEKAESRRKKTAAVRGRKHINPVGAHRSLLESYLRVSLDMDLHVPDAPRLSWSPTRSRRRFGHHDPAHDCIVISRVLDDPKVPSFVLDFVVYHEMLHIALPPKQGSGNKRIVHHKAFREAEARFPRRDEAERWLARLARG